MLLAFSFKSTTFPKESEGVNKWDATAFIYNVAGIPYTSLVLLHKYDQGYITAPWNQQREAPVEPEERPRPPRAGQPRWQQGELARHADFPADFRDRWIHNPLQHPQNGWMGKCDYLIQLILPGNKTQFDKYIHACPYNCRHVYSHKSLH